MLLVAPLALALGACATVPTGPSVMVLPGTGKPFEQFQADDGACRQFALRSAGITTKKAASDSMLTGAAVGTAVGVEIFGEWVAGSVAVEPLYDPTGERIRA